MASRWYLGRNNQTEGPYSLEQLTLMANNGELLPADLLLPEGGQNWAPASSVPGIFLSVSATPSLQPSPIPYKDPNKSNFPARSWFSHCSRLASV